MECSTLSDHADNQRRIAAPAIAVERLRAGAEYVERVSQIIDAWTQQSNELFMNQPWLWDLPPDDRRYYPLYATCVELGVPFCTQIGHTGPLCPSEPGRPIPYLDNVLLEFPDLVVVGGHVGYPWIDEVISLATKYPNFYVDTSAYAVHRLPDTLIRYLRGHGRSRVLFGSNWPMLSPQRCMEHLDRLDLDDEARELLLGGNAARVFQLGHRVARHFVEADPRSRIVGHSPAEHSATQEDQ